MKRPTNEAIASGFDRSESIKRRVDNVRVRRKRFTLTIDYAAYRGFKEIAAKFGVVVGTEEFGTRIVLDAEVPEGSAADFDARISDLSRGMAVPRYLPA